MNLPNFADSFGHDRLPAPNYYRDEQTHSLIEDMRKRALPFQEITDVYTRGSTPGASDVFHESVLYDSWAQQQFPHALQGAFEQLDHTEMPDVDRDRELQRLLAESAFVMMNTAMAYNWHHLTTDAPMPHDTIHRAQLRLALAGLPLAEDLDTMLRSDILFDPPTVNSSGRRITNHLSAAALGLSSAANEIDSALIAHEASKRDPHIIILPAPGYYEHGIPHRLNVDLFAIHTLKRQIVPIQVKSSVRNAIVEDYDPRVTFIDSGVDLANTRSVRRPGQSTQTNVPWGGLVSVHTIANEKNLFRINSEKGKAFRPNASHQILLRARQSAKQLSRAAKSHNREAARTIADRIEYALDEPVPAALDAQRAR